VSNWLERNQSGLAAELDRIFALLSDGEEIEGAEPPALGLVVRAFGLSPFERDVLLLCTGVELEARFAELCASATGDDRGWRPTFALALAALPDAHWSALAPAAPLRRWRLVELDQADTLVASPLRIDERVLHHLTGLEYLDQRLAALVEHVEPPASLPASQSRFAARVAAGCRDRAPLVLSGADAETRRAVAAAGYAVEGVKLHAIAAADVPAHADERHDLARLWEREAVLMRSALLVEVEDEADRDIENRARALVETVSPAAACSAREPQRLRLHHAVRVEVALPTPTEQQRLWEAALGDAAAGLNGALGRIVQQFDLGAPAIGAAALRANGEDGIETALWDACRAQARPRLDDLAQRIVTVSRWEDLVLPSLQGGILHEIAAHVRGRSRVYEDWGFATRGARGLGISALFQGPSGTGKTMAAEVLASELRLDLYRIDLSQVVSKYIGETEKNLRRVFEAAESGGAILLFDEADALFGKRSEVRDSHDRYANIEVGYLLQRMEAYRGLAILTTNTPDAIDRAFMRRIRFVVEFPFPDEAQRAEIWRRIFPEKAPTRRLDLPALARLSLAGGTIRNAALGAAFLAADEDTEIGMGQVARAARREALKLGRPLTEAETRAWT
jgi:hypothetical protein